MASDSALGRELTTLDVDAARVKLRMIKAKDRQAATGLWPSTARAGQVPRGTGWRTWLILAGRGFGKTRAGAEWVHHLATTAPPGKPCHIALVGATIDDARATMVEGVSGILTIAPAVERPQFNVSQGMLHWPGGATARLYSGAKPDGLRGGEFSFAWCDEIAKWTYPDAAWSNLQLALRQGASPRAVVTTTPRHGPFLTALRAAPGIIETRGRTRENPALPAAFIASVEAMYGGTRLARQEMDGEVLTDLADALWTRATIEAARVFLPWGKTRHDPAHHDCTRIVIGVDPAAGSARANSGSGAGTAAGDECGIVAVGQRPDGTAIVLEDATTPGSVPHVWAGAVAACAARWHADLIVAEANNGGEMVRSVLHAADADLPVKLVRASRGKAARAEPVALLYEQRRIRHAQAFVTLEDQLCGMTTHGYEGPGRSPDRADALVWAVTELTGKRRVPRVRGL